MNTTPDIETPLINVHKLPASTPRQRKPESTDGVLACVDHSDHAKRVVDHASALAEALDVPLSLLHVLETQGRDRERPDPIEWQLKRQGAKHRLHQLASGSTSDAEVDELKLAEGRPAGEICRQTQTMNPAFIVVGTQGERVTSTSYLGGTIRDLLDAMTRSMLIVPVSGVTGGTPQYKRILIPIDGSQWAESVLPLATRLARSGDAELILAHVIPSPVLTEIGPLEQEDLRLRKQVTERNEATARAYLDRLRRQLVDKGLKVRVELHHGRDPREELSRMLQAEAPDLVLMSSRGHGCDHVPDVPYGSVAAYIVGHSQVPVLIMPSGCGVNRPKLVSRFQRSHAAAIRLG